MSKDTNVEFSNNRNGVTFETPSDRVNIKSKETIPVIFGKIRKFFADLKPVAFSGSYVDLSNKPTIPTISNSLTSTSTTIGLSAAQGKILNDKISNITSTSSSSLNIVNTVGTVPNDVKYIYKNGCIKCLGLEIKISKTITIGSTIATVPSGYEPKHTAMCNSAELYSGKSRMFQMTSDGHIKLYGDSILKGEIYYIIMTYI